MHDDVSVQLKFPLFIAVEGIDNAGKSTLVKALKVHLENYYEDIITTREPGGQEGDEGLGNIIRSCLLNSADSAELGANTQLLYHFTARYDHVRRLIAPALEKRCWVVCDRYYDSSYAYQVHGQNASSELYSALEGCLLETWPAAKPDLVVYLDIDPVGAAQRATDQDEFEQALEAQDQSDENGGLLNRMREGFFYRASLDPHRYAIINANQSFACVLDHALKAVHECIETKAECYKSAL